MSDVADPAARLAGIRILEVGHMLAGPYAGMQLADLGADVIKIEPADGDISRQVGSDAVAGLGLYFTSLNRNKKSVQLDLATPAGQEALGRLASTAAALIVNMKPSAIRRLGLDYERLRRWNDRLVCVAITGFGLEGPEADRPAFDYIIQARTGIAAMTGDPDGPPTLAGYSAVDNSAGTAAVVAVLTGLVSGRGGQFDISLHDVMLSQLNYKAAAALQSGDPPRRLPGGGHPYYVPAQILATADGYLALFITHDRFWTIFAEDVGRPEWIDDPRLATMAARAAHRDLVVDLVAGVVRTQTTDHWLARLEPLGLPVAAVNHLAAALDSPLTAGRDMVVTIDSDGVPVRVVGNPIKESGRSPDLPRRAPHLGEHTTEILRALPEHEPKEAAL